MSKRVAIVTGGAGGIGQAITEALTQEGIQVVIADLQEAEGHAVATKLNAHAITTDLAHREDCQHLVDETLAHYGRVDILVNNAGVQHIAPIEEFPVDTWDNMLEVMLTAPFLLTKHVWPSMKANGWGRIINIASIHGQVASPFKSAYITAKHGLIGLTRTAALEGGEHGITVNAICPAYVQTPLVENQVASQAQIHGLSPEDVVTQVMLSSAAIKRFIKPEEVASLVAYLCSETAGAITGAAWTIDLGWTAQ